VTDQPERSANRPFIDGYGDGGFRIAGTLHRGSIFLLPDRVLAWAVTDFAAADADSLAPLLAGIGDTELVLIGTGARMTMLPKPMREVCRAAGLGVEPMDTGAAARTYNVLVAEDRRVAAALIAV
jgi:uncharacterized protein